MISVPDVNVLQILLATHGLEPNTDSGEVVRGQLVRPCVYKSGHRRSITRRDMAK
jgi:hypothetical protein